MISSEKHSQNTWTHVEREISMSHELDDNIERRKQIVMLIPSKGLTPNDFLRLIMDQGYNHRGAQSKAKELRFLKMIEEKDGKVFAAQSLK